MPEMSAMMVSGEPRQHDRKTECWRSDNSWTISLWMCSDVFRCVQMQELGAKMGLWQKRRSWNVCLPDLDHLGSVSSIAVCSTNSVKFC